MPRIKSAIKRVQVTERNRKRNVAYVSAIRNAIKKVLVLLKDQPDSAQNALKVVYSLLDKAVLKGVVHKNSAARYKSRLAKKFMSQAS